jgi:tetratricopeptide (TPR) repeat protein
MAEASLLRGNTLDAVTYADLAVSSGAGGRVGLLVLGRCLAADDRHAEAVSTFSSVLERWPADRDALRGKAESFQAIGRFAQAYDLWTNYLKFFKDPATEEEKAAALAAKSQRAVCLEGQGLEVEARAVWTSLLSEGTLNGDGSMRKAALEGLADHELENGNFSQAESLYRELMQATTETTDATVQLRLALCLHLQSRSGEVSVVLSHLLLNAPDAVVTIFTEDRFQPLRGYLIPNA